MNVASHEMEDSGPLTAERYERDYGYVDHHMNPLGYDMVNNMDMVVADCNRIEHVHSGQKLSIDLLYFPFRMAGYEKPRTACDCNGYRLAGTLYRRNYYYRTFHRF